MDRYQSLLDIFVEADLDTPIDLTAAIASLPWPGMLPSPWTTWTLIGLINYRARKRWAHDMIRARLAPRLGLRSGGAVALEEARGRHIMPGLPEWECLLDGMYSQVVNRISNEHIHVDLINGPEIFSSCQLADHFQSQRHPGPAVRRLVELHPSCWALRLPVEELHAA